MEVFAELLVGLLQVVCEALLQLLGEALIELGWYSLREAIIPSTSPRRLLSLLGFALLGAAFGGLSLLVLPKHFATSIGLRILTVLVAPCLTALAMMPIARLFPRHFGRSPGWQFATAYAFGLPLALIRFFWAH